MPVPTVSEFSAALPTFGGEAAPTELLALRPALLQAFEEVVPFRPLSIRPVAGPWEKADALAFEASWADTHALLVALRPSADPAHAAQVRLMRAGQTIYAVNATAEQLASVVSLCLGRHLRRPNASARPATSPDEPA